METLPRAPAANAFETYLRMTVLWHESTARAFDPVAAVVSLASSQGLLVKQTLSPRTGRTTLRVDTPESKGKKKGGPVVDKTTRREASKLLRRALRDPALAERIKDLILRQAAGEDVSAELTETIGR